MDFLDQIKQRLPDYAKDIRLNLDAVVLRSSLPADEAIGAALAAAFAAKSTALTHAIRESDALTAADQHGALAAAALMGMTNVWYSYLDLADDPELKNQPAQLRMNVYANHAGVGARKFELWALAASIVGKCRYCVGAHVAELQKVGIGTSELRDVGRIAAVIQAAALVLQSEAAPH